MINLTDAIISPKTRLPGWLYDLEEAMLIRLASEVPENGKILEIGCEYGRSTGAFILGANSSVSIYSVDLFPAILDTFGVSHNMQAVHASNLKEAGFDGRSQQIKGDSKEVGKKWHWKKKLDLLFVDGDHNIENVLGDLWAWTPHVKVGGTMIVHDASCQTNLHPHYLHFDVSKALDQWLAEVGVKASWVELPSVESTRVFQRIK